MTLQPTAEYIFATEIENLMLDNYKILTVTHRNTHLKEIGNFVIQDVEGSDLRNKLEALKQHFGLEELLYLNTCNRVMYLFRKSNSIDPTFLTQFFQFINPGLSSNNLIKKVSLFEGLEAIEHLQRVAASIDSMVVGERQILRQLREAYEQCAAWGLTGDKIRLAISSAIEAAKEVYSKTKIGEKQVSIVSLAVHKLLDAGISKKSRVLMVGAGQTNALVAKFLRKYQFENVTIFNRSFDKAQQLSKMVDGEAYPLSGLESYSEGFDCLIVCTGATQPIIDKALYSKLLGDDKSRKVVVDLSIPHNIEQKLVGDFNVNYVEIEGLRALAAENLGFREQEVTKANELLSQQLQQFQSAYNQRLIELAMHQVPCEVKAVKERAMQEVFKKEMEPLDGEARALIERMMTYMEKKCIGIPMKAARQAVLN